MKKLLYVLTGFFLYKTYRWFRDYVSNTDPVISSITPFLEYSGAILDIEGSNFGSLREDNLVTIGGIQARVIEASTTKLKVISAIETVTGPIKVKVGTKEGTSTTNFTVKPYPSPGDGEDGPPVLYQGGGFPSSGDVPPTGTLRILVCLVCPTDRVPAAPATARTNVVNRWANVSTFYNQVSYGALTVQVDVTNTWHTLSGNFNDYVNDTLTDTSANERDAQNIRVSVLSRIMAEAASAAQGTGESFNLNNYQLIACVVNLNGTFIRAWGGSSTNNFRYDPLSINITTTNPINELWIQESADWGRCAHETGHNIVANPSGLSANDDFAERTLGEDIYDSDLIDPAVATAQKFDMMGLHDTHPMFSGYHMEKTGWYNSANIRDLVWDRNPFSQEFDIIAHGTAQDATANRHHLLKIKVGAGLFYYVEVRQRPSAVSPEYVYDTEIPVPGGDGGVVVTKVVTDLVHNNQQMRFISLLHGENVLRQGDSAEDPARTLKITVINDNVQARPLVCRVKVEWAQIISDTIGGLFDLRLEPWGSNWQSSDIWVDRQPFGTFDQPNDSEGRPQNNGDKPRPREINRFFSRIRNDGSISVNNVNVTFYSVNPPGIGDNGNWSPIRTETITSIANNSFQDISTNWVPVLGEHTCLKVFISQQSGEVTGGNNSAQENVFEFEAPAASVPQAVYIPVAVRNPLNQRTIIRMAIHGAKIGYIVQFPHEWLWLDPLEERQFILTVVPYLDYNVYKSLPNRFKRNEKEDYASKIKVTGFLPRTYNEQVGITSYPGSKLERIGGIFARVKPKKKVSIRLFHEKRRNDEYNIVLEGLISPAMNNQSVRVDLQSPIFDTLYAGARTDSTGRFAAVFNLKELIQTLIQKEKIRDEEEFESTANMIAQAFVIDAAEAADASSNIVNVTL